MEAVTVWPSLLWLESPYPVIEQPLPPRSSRRHWLPEAPGRVVVIDPIRTPTAAQADIHLQLFPGSDAALAFALLHVIHREGLIDSAFVAAHVQGWEELEPMLAACHPRWGEAHTGVPAALIEEVAVLYARGPSLLWLGQGLQRQVTGGNVMRACGLLPALTGNLGKPGAGFLYLNGNLRQRRLLLDARLSALDPHAPLARGFALVFAEGRLVRDASSVAAGTEITAKLARGTLRARVEGSSDD